MNRRDFMKLLGKVPVVAGVVVVTGLPEVKERQSVGDDKVRLEHVEWNGADGYPSEYLANWGDRVRAEHAEADTLYTRGDFVKWDGLGSRWRRYPANAEWIKQ